MLSGPSLHPPEPATWQVLEGPHLNHQQGAPVVVGRAVRFRSERRGEDPDVGAFGLDLRALRAAGQHGNSIVEVA